MKKEKISLENSTQRVSMTTMSLVSRPRSDCHHLYPNPNHPALGAIDRHRSLTPANHRGHCTPTCTMTFMLRNHSAWFTTRRNTKKYNIHTSSTKDVKCETFSSVVEVVGIVDGRYLDTTAGEQAVQCWKLEHCNGH